MERVNKILQNHQYKEYLTKNREAEAHRCFCHHNMSHFLDVARIAMLLNREEDYRQNQEMIYVAALLHDIGRWKQYLDQTPHEEASAVLAGNILKECDFSEEESNLIIMAIRNHRNTNIQGDKTLAGLLFRADKLSRPCFACEQEANCNWKADKKNLKLLW